MVRSFKDLSPRVFVLIHSLFFKKKFRQTTLTINNARVKFPFPALRKFSVQAKLSTSF